MFDSFQLTPTDYSAQLQAMQMPTAQYGTDWSAAFADPEFQKAAMGILQKNQGQNQSPPSQMIPPMQAQTPFQRGGYRPMRSEILRQGILNMGGY